MPFKEPIIMPALFVDQLTVIDFAFFDPVRGIVGESWIVDLVLEGDLDDQGMVFDFGDVKKRIKQAIDSTLDHKFAVPSQYAELSITEDGDKLTLDMRDKQGRFYQHKSPRQAVALIPTEIITRESALPLLHQACSEVVPDNVKKIFLNLRTEEISGDYYHYVHGLKKHLGDCQRIAHGHRSQIHIFENGQRNKDLEAYWCDLWRDIYIGTAEDLQKDFEDDAIQYFEFAYRSEQGEFSLVIPAERCHIMEQDSTVELIAQHIADQLKEKHPKSEIEVRAFEGVNKGAIAFS